MGSPNARRLICRVNVLYQQLGAFATIPGPVEPDFGQFYQSSLPGNIRLYTLAMLVRTISHFMGVEAGLFRSYWSLDCPNSSISVAIK